MNFSETTLRALEPLCEHIVALDAAANFKMTFAGILEEQSRQANSSTVQLEFVNKAQQRLKDADAYRMQMRELMAEARRIAKADGKSLPGMMGIKAIADRYSARLFHSA